MFCRESSCLHRVQFGSSHCQFIAEEGKKNRMLKRIQKLEVEQVLGGEGWRIEGKDECAARGQNSGNWRKIIFESSFVAQTGM